METLTLRKSIIDYIKTADERILKVVKAVMETYEDETPVAKSIEGKTITKSEYRQELLHALNEIKEGKTISQEDLEKDSESW